MRAVGSRCCGEGIRILKPEAQEWRRKMLDNKKMLFNLLAYIRRDDGQYVHEHGVEEAYYDAVCKISGWLHTEDALKSIIQNIQNQ